MNNILVPAMDKSCHLISHTLHLDRLVFLIYYKCSNNKYFC